MNEPAAVLNLLTGSATGLAASALVAALWQGALLAGLVWLCLRFVPQLTAAVRSAVWLCVFVLLVGLQVAPMVARGGAARPVLHPVLHLDPRWSLALAALWLAASAVRAAQLLHGVLYLRRLAAQAVEVPQSTELTAALEEASPRRLFGNLLGSHVRLCTSEAIARPSVIGFFRPRVLMPARLMSELSPQELRQVLMHELEHLRRADDWTNLLQKVALVIFPLNPALAWVERRLCAERELACDDRVLAAGSGRKAYALCLTHLAEFALLERGFSLVLGAWEHRPELVRRVHRILSAPGQSMNRWAALGVSGGVLAAAAGGAVALAHSPQLVSFAPPATVARAEAPVLTKPTTSPAEMALRTSAADDAGSWSARHQAAPQLAEPQLVKATLAVERVECHPAARPAVAVAHPAGRKPAAPARMMNALAKKPATGPQIKLAGLRLPPPPGNGTLLVMTEWTDLGTTQQMILANLRTGKGPAATAVPAIYVVATPNGLLIVQI